MKTSKTTKLDMYVPLGPSQPPPLPVHAPQFEGSLGMLLKLSHQRKVDLTDIPLAPLAKEYTLYLTEVQDNDLNSAGLALLAIAYLVERKSALLMEDDEPEIELPALIDPSIHLYQDAVNYLDEQFDKRGELYFRNQDSVREQYHVPLDMDDITLDLLATAFSKLLEKAVVEVKHEPNRPKFSLRDKIESILRQVEQSVDPLPFETFFPMPFSRLDAVWTFLAVLELAKLGSIDFIFEQSDIKIVSKKLFFVSEEIQG